MIGRQLVKRLRCPHHRRFCKGAACCCRDRHWRFTTSKRTLRNRLNGGKP